MNAIGTTWRDPLWYCIVAAPASTAWMVLTWKRRLAFELHSGTVYLQTVLFGASWGSLFGLTVLAVSS